MKKWILLVLIFVVVSGLVIGVENHINPCVIKTYEKTSFEEKKELLKNSELIITKTHYKMSDGTWKVDDYTYQYKLEVTGRLHNAVKDITYVILSNTEDITFEQAWKASGLSSYTKDYFRIEDAVFVGMG